MGVVMQDEILVVRGRVALSVLFLVIDITRRVVASWGLLDEWCASLDAAGRGGLSVEEGVILSLAAARARGGDDAVELDFTGGDDAHS